jgi:hypothetical protein
VYKEDQDAPEAEIWKLMRADLELWKDHGEVRGEHAENGTRAQKIQIGAVLLCIHFAAHPQFPSFLPAGEYTAWGRVLFSGLIRRAAIIVAIGLTDPDQLFAHAYNIYTLLCQLLAYGEPSCSSEQFLSGIKLSFQSETQVERRHFRSG